MRTAIWKFSFHNFPSTNIMMDPEAQVIHVAYQHGVICLWAMVNPDAVQVVRKFRIFGTGFDFDPNGLNFIGTVLTADEQFVWHVFEEAR